MDSHEESELLSVQVFVRNATTGKEAAFDVSERDEREALHDKVSKELQLNPDAFKLEPESGGVEWPPHYGQRFIAVLSPKQVALADLEKREYPATAEGMCSAAFNNDVEAIKLFIRAGISPETCDEALGRAPIHAAAEVGACEVLKTILEQWIGSTVNLPAADGAAPLHCLLRGAKKTAESGEATDDLAEALNLLLEKGADPNMKGGEYIPLQWAVQVQELDRHGEWVEVLIEAGAVIPSDNKMHRVVGKVLRMLTTANKSQTLTTLRDAIVRKKQKTLKAFFTAPKAEESILVFREEESNPESLVHFAAAEGNEYAVLQLLKLSSDPKTEASRLGPTSIRMNDRILSLAKSVALRGPTDEGGCPPLFWAACHGMCKAIHALLDAGADPNTLTAAGETALYAAAVTNNREAAWILVDGGADITEREKNMLKEKCPARLHDVLDIWDLKLMKCLGGFDVDQKDNEQKTVLHLAALSGNEEEVKFLVEEWGADVEIRARNGDTALAMAVREGNVTNVQVLLDHGANPNVEGNSETPLHKACRVRPLEVARVLVRKLLEKGGNPFAKNLQGRTPLVIAKEAGKELLKAFGEVDEAKEEEKKRQVTDLDKKWDVPAVLATVMQKETPLEEVKRVLEATSNEDAHTAHPTTKETPLHRAVHNEDVDCAALLLSHGAPVDAVDVNRYSPLLIAAGRRHHELVELLLRYGASVNPEERTEGRLCPLVLACAHKDEKMVTMLLDKGANVSGKGYPKPPLASAAAYGDGTLLGALKILHDKRPAGAPSLTVFDNLLKEPRNERLLGREEADIAFADLVRTDRIVTIMKLLGEATGAIMLGVGGEEEEEEEGRLADVLLPPDCCPRPPHSLLELLVDSGADVNVVIPWERVRLTLLTFSAVYRDTDTVKLFLERGADPNKTSGEGTLTPLFVAAVYRDKDLINILLEGGAEAGASLFNVPVVAYAAGCDDILTPVLVFIAAGDLQHLKEGCKPKQLFGFGMDVLRRVVAHFHRMRLSSSNPHFGYVDKLLGRGAHPYSRAEIGAVAWQWLAARWKGAVQVLLGKCTTIPAFLLQRAAHEVYGSEELRSFFETQESITALSPKSYDSQLKPEDGRNN